MSKYFTSLSTIFSVYSSSVVLVVNWGLSVLLARLQYAVPQVITDQHLCHSLSELCDSLTCHIQNFKILASLCSRADWFEHYLVGNHKDRFYRDIRVIYTTWKSDHANNSNSSKRCKSVSCVDPERGKGEGVWTH